MYHQNTSFSFVVQYTANSLLDVSSKHIFQLSLPTITTCSTK